VSDAGYTILVPIATHLAAARQLLEIAAALIPVESEPRGRVVALGIVEIPDELAFGEGASSVRLERQRLGRMLRLKHSPAIEVRSLVRVSTQVWQGVLDAAREEQAALILFGWKGWTNSAHRIFGGTIDEVVRNAPCDIAVVKQPSLAGARRILLPVRGGPHGLLTLRLATGLAERLDGRVTALHIEQPGLDEDEATADREQVEALLAQAGDPSRVDSLVVVADSIETAILRAARGHEIVVMGATPGDPRTPFLFGAITEGVAQRLKRTVVVVKSHELPSVPPAAPTAPEARSLSTVVDKWFVENSFHSTEFEDLAELVALKERQGLRISLGLPTLNEAETIGPIIGTMQRELIDRFPLLDEMVVIDSGSADDTVAIARDHGVPVYVHQEVLPEYGAFHGKGEALWKSLYVLRGDLIAWIDTDIKNIHPRFVYGLLGPLLRQPRLRYVKGYYRRPLRLGSSLQKSGGGRVTELTARPLLNLFFPELSGFLQPLSGEYAGRRAALESVPFFTGYGVEIGLLVDLLQQFGLGGLSQVDLQQRVHRNQALGALTKMAFTIIQVVIKRLEDRHRLQLLAEVNKSMKLVVEDRQGYRLEVKELQDFERPPIATLPEYRERHPGSVPPFSAAGDGRTDGKSDPAQGAVPTERSVGPRTTVPALVPRPRSPRAHR
jgi:nucleotide-binding universal stress UspA family protein